ncbi:alanine racemase [Roseofilum casamattae]|uniref:Alanine racemase n=1 Tax=Roseofilum casamattae BLCC-M143 TaxID=3022442 RepID=A0ABT7BY80_9CYAN|nr:alanine racemase [Roseofilum casamattae]MDJ1184152.1 alanine racemase [Roseofilum casamattae BLCC-M143]
MRSIDDNNQEIKDEWRDDVTEFRNWMEISPMIPETLFEIATDIPTPALVYDLDAIADTVTALRNDLSQIPNSELCLAVKANRCPSVLRHMAKLGLGADIASIQELDAALAAGLRPIYATAPGFSVADLKRLAAEGVIPDLCSLSQLRVWCESVNPNKRVGLRLRLPVREDSKAKNVVTKWSRFGVDPKDPGLHRLIQTHELEVVHLHVHEGETFSEADLHQTLDFLVSCLEIFPKVEVLNLGGGWAYLFHLQKSEAQRVWDLFNKTMTRINNQRQQPVRLAIEPGMLLTMMAGYLVAEVKAADDRPSGHRIVVLDTSAWNLMFWAPRPAVARIPFREGPMLVHDLAGCTCYETDYFCQNEKMARVEVGDRLILNASGAYTSSVARSLHGLPIPKEFVIRDNRLCQVD